MTTGGWITLLVATALVWGLAIWCYYRVLTAPSEEHLTEPPESPGG